MSEIKKVFALGTWIVDYIKEIEDFPKRNELTVIKNDFQFGGGGSFNFLMNLKNIVSDDIGLYGLGRIGSDAASDFIIKILLENNINTELLEKREGEKTAYTIVLAEKKSHIRSFLFYNTNIDRKYSRTDIERLTNWDFNNSIFYIGYLNIMEGLLNYNSEKKLQMAVLLHLLREKGALIIADCVSLENFLETSISFNQLIEITMPLIDILFMNEIELGKFLSMNFRDNNEALNQKKLEESLTELQKRNINTCIIHFPEGAYIIDKTEIVFVPSFKIKQNEIVGTLGAGDAFCAGVVNGILSQKAKQDILYEGHAMAYFNLKTHLSIYDKLSKNIIQEFVENKTYG